MQVESHRALDAVVPSCDAVEDERVESEASTRPSRGDHRARGAARRCDYLGADGARLRSLAHGTADEGRFRPQHGVIHGHYADFKPSSAQTVEIIIAVGVQHVLCQGVVEASLSTRSHSTASHDHIASSSTVAKFRLARRAAAVRAQMIAPRGRSRRSSTTGFAKHASGRVSARVCSHGRGAGRPAMTRRRRALDETQTASPSSPRTARGRPRTPTSWSSRSRTVRVPPWRARPHPT